MASNLNLLGSLSRVETPFVKVTIGSYSFGAYDRQTVRAYDAQGAFKMNKVTYPNYVQSLSVQKINGSVNTYTLVFIYPITSENDPNFFEKVFSSVASTRRIAFTYGDLSSPSFVYKEEEAIITAVTNSFSMSASTITYTVKAVSSADMSRAGSYKFPAAFRKPSDVIRDMLYKSADRYGLLGIFYGMRDRTLVEEKGLLAGDDASVQLEMKSNISVLDYLTYLVSCMKPSGSVSTLLRSAYYSLVVVDDVSGIFGGPYFKVMRVDSGASSSDKLETYSIDIGYPGQNVVTAFSVENNENYSIYYDFAQKLASTDYATRIGDDGKTEYVYAPTISSTSAVFKTTEAEKTWWTKITEFPISVTLTLKGLLRPAILMTHVRLGVYFYGRKHISSGTYIITKQIDEIGFSGFRTTLSMTRIGGDESPTA